MPPGCSGDRRSGPSRPAPSADRGADPTARQPRRGRRRCASATGRTCKRPGNGTGSAGELGGRPASTDRSTSSGFAGLARRTPTAAAPRRLTSVSATRSSSGVRNSSARSRGMAPTTGSRIPGPGGPSLTGGSKAPPAGRRAARRRLRQISLAGLCAAAPSPRQGPPPPARAIERADLISPPESLAKARRLLVRSTLPTLPTVVVPRDVIQQIASLMGLDVDVVVRLGAVFGALTEVEQNDPAERPTDPPAGVATFGAGPEITGPLLIASTAMPAVTSHDEFAAIDRLSQGQADYQTLRSLDRLAILAGLPTWSELFPEVDR